MSDTNILEETNPGAYEDAEAMQFSIQGILQALSKDAATSELIQKMFGFSSDGEDQLSGRHDEDLTDDDDDHKPAPLAVEDKEETSTRALRKRKLKPKKEKLKPEKEGTTSKETTATNSSHEYPVPFPVDVMEENPAGRASGPRNLKRKKSETSSNMTGTVEIGVESNPEGLEKKKGRYRIRKSLALKTNEQRLHHFNKRWYDLNNRVWTEAKKNIRKYMVVECQDAQNLADVVKGFDLESHLSADQKYLIKPMPDFDKMDRTVWSGDVARMAVDEKGIPLLIVFPKWLNNDAETILYNLLMDFAREVEVKIKDTPADKKGRDQTSSYTRKNIQEEVHGVFQLVTMWRGIGRWNGDAGPSRDILNKIPNFNAALRLMKNLQVMSRRLDHLFQIIDPSQHAIFSEARKRLEKEHPSYAAVGGIDPTFFHGRSLIFNRETPRHVDSKDTKVAWTPVITLGKYTSGVMRVLDLEVDYGSGTMVFLRGGSIPHAVTFQGGQRVAVAHFMHQNILEDVHIGPLPIAPVWN